MCPWAEYDGSTAQEDVRPPISFAEVRMLEALIVAGTLMLLGACMAAPVVHERSSTMRPQIHLTGEWAIVHRCRDCGTLSSNRIAADGNEMLLLSLTVKPLAQPPFPLDRL